MLHQGVALGCCRLRATSQMEAHSELKALLTDWKRQAYDPLKVEPQQAIDWLREYVAVNWKETEYADLRRKASKMLAEGNSREEIRDFLFEYGLDWKIDTSQEVQQSLQQRLNTYIQREKMFAGKQSYQVQLDETRKEISVLTSLLEQLKQANHTQERWQLLIQWAEIKGERIRSEQEKEINQKQKTLESSKKLFKEIAVNERVSLEKEIKELEEDLNQRRANLKDLTAVLDQTAKKASLERRIELLENASLLPKPQPFEEATQNFLVKEAQINEFLAHEVFDKHQRFTREGVLHMLTSMEILH